MAALENAWGILASSAERDRRTQQGAGRQGLASSPGKKISGFTGAPGSPQGQAEVRSSCFYASFNLVQLPPLPLRHLPQSIPFEKKLKSLPQLHV